LLLCVLVSGHSQVLSGFVFPSTDRSQFLLSSAQRTELSSKVDSMRVIQIDVQFLKSMVNTFEVCAPGGTNLKRQDNNGIAGQKRGKVNAVLEMAELDEVMFQIHPNPVKEWLIVESSAPIEQVIIYNTSGQEVYRKDWRGILQGQLSVTDWPTGMYWLQARAANQVINQTFIVAQ